MPEIVIPEFMEGAAVAGLAAEFDVLHDPGLVDRPPELMAALATAQALIVRNRTQVRGALLEAAAELRVVGRLGVGLDNIDLAACERRGITVCSAAGANAVSVAEYVVTGLLMLLRGAYRASGRVLEGDWPRTELVGREVAGKTLGLVGFGATARAVAVRARALGMAVVAADPLVPADDPVWRELVTEPATLEDLLAASDAVSLHVPLTDQTRHLIDAAALAGMKPGAVLINAARGGVVDEAALAAALSAGALGGALLDVFETEPLPAGSPLAAAPNLILTPHIAGLTEEANARVSAVTAEKVRRFLRREAPRPHRDGTSP